MDRLQLPVSLSPLDEERFGIKSARTALVTSHTLPEMMNFCLANQVVFFIARCRTDDFETVHAMERYGFNLMDTLVYYECNVEKNVPAENKAEVIVRPLRTGDEVAIQDLAAKSFHNYFGHYHADPKLDKQKCDEVYSSWAMQCCTKQPPSESEAVLVAENETKIVGLLAIQLSKEGKGDGLILCVEPSLRNKGVSRALMISGMEWCRVKGYEQMTISTQIINTKVQRVWTRLGFEISHTYYTYHKWFD